MKATEIIVNVMKDVQAVAKADRNQAQNFNFRGIDAVVNAIGPALRKHGGFIVPQVNDRVTEVLPSKNGGSLNVVRLDVTYEIHGSEGEPISGRVYAEAFDSGDKATAKAMSVAFRTFMLQVFALPTDEPDPDTHSYEIGKPAELDQATREKLVKAIAGATDKEQLRVLWQANTNVLDVEWLNSLDEPTTLKQLILSKQAELN